MKKIVCLIPLYNEQEVLGALFLRLGALFDSLCARYEMSVLLVDDGSADGSLALLREQHARDADLQDPPELIPQMLELFEQGYDDVYARRRSRAGESAAKRLTSHLYYRVLGWLSAVPIQPDTGDFRLLSHRFVAALQKLREMPRCTKSLFSWVGYRKTALYYDRDPRAAGKSKFRFLRLCSLAADGITALSIRPLQLLWVLPACGFISFLACFVLWAALGGTWLLLCWLLLLLFAAQTGATALLGMYLGRAFLQNLGRPGYLIEERDGQGADK